MTLSGVLPEIPIRSGHVPVVDYDDYEFRTTDAGDAAGK